MARVIATATVNVKADASQAERELKGIGKGLNFSGITGKLATIGSAIGALGLGNLAREAVSFGGEYRVQLDNAAAAVRGLVTNTSAADKLLRDMTQFAINTPFKLPGVQDATAQLLAVGKGFGVTSDTVLDYVKIYGNAVAITGGSEDTLRRVVRNFGQMSSSGKVLGRDMNDLANNIPGLDVWGALAEGTGKSTQELRKLQDEGKLDELLTGNEAVQILTKAMEEMPGAAGAMERKMQTLGGSVEYFKDAIGIALADGLQPFFTTLQQTLSDPAIMDGLVGLIEVFAELASGIFKGLAPVLPDLISAFEGIVEALLPLAPVAGILVGIFADLLVAITPIIEVGAQFVAWLAGLLATLDPSVLTVIAGALGTLWLVGFGPIGLIAAAVAGLAVVIAQNWDWIVEKTQFLVDGIVDIWNSDWMQGMVDTITGFVDDVVAAFGWFTEELPAILEGVGEGAQEAFAWVDEVPGWFETVQASITDAFSDIWSNIPFKEQASDAFGFLVDEVPGWFSDAKDRIVEAFAPVADGLGEVAEQLEPVFEALKRLVAVVIAVVSPTIAVLVTLGLFFFNFAKRFVGPFVQFVGDMLGGLITIVANILGFIANIIMFRWGDAWNNVTAILGAAVGLIGSYLSIIWSTITAVFGAILETVSQIWGFLWDRIGGVISSVVGTILGPVLDFVNAIVGAFQWLYDVLVGNSIIPDMVNAIIGWFQTLFDLVSVVLDALKAVIVAVWEGIKAVVETVVGAIVAFVQLEWNGIKVIVETVLNAIKVVVETVWNVIKSIVSTVVNGIKTTVESVWNGIKWTATVIWTAIQEAILDPIRTARNLIGAIVDTLKRWFEAPIQAALDFIEDVWSGITDFILDPLRAAADAVGGIVSKITGPVKGALDAVKGVATAGGNWNPVNWLAEGRIVTRPTIVGVGEAGAEAVIPLTNPARAMALMQQSGLDRLAAQMNSQPRGFSGPLVSMPGAVIQDATDADLVAQRTLVAMQAAMVA